VWQSSRGPFEFEFVFSYTLGVEKVQSPLKNSKAPATSSIQRMMLDVGSDDV
jgi:hypothetical protein